MPKASAAETSASSRLSVSNCQMMRRRDAPIASRMPISRWRATRAREQQVGHVRAPDQQDEAEREEERREHQQRLGRQRAPCPASARGRGSRRVGRREPSAARCESHARSSASAWPRDSPGFSRPTMLDADGRRSRPAGAAAELAEERERRPEVRRGDRLESSKALRHHADHLERRSVHQDRRGRARRDRSRSAATRRDG